MYHQTATNKRGQMLIRGDRSGGTVQATRLLAACAPMAVGVFGWLAAHLLTFWLLAHSHGDMITAAGRRLHHYTATATVLAGCLTAASLLAALVSAPSTRSRDSKPSERGRAARRAAWMSTLAFATAELAEHGLFGGDRKPPLILLAGMLLHAVAGALATVTWHHYHDAVHRLWSLNLPSTADILARAQSLSTSLPVPRRRLHDSCLASRAPPRGLAI